VAGRRFRVTGVSDLVLCMATGRDGAVLRGEFEGVTMISIISNCESEGMTEGHAIGAIWTVLCLSLTRTVTWNDILSEGTSLSSSGKTLRACSSAA
jgi:hypothetical protein